MVDRTLTAETSTCWKRYCIVEEVPGVPENEAYYVRGPDLGYPFNHFASYGEAATFLFQRGIQDFDFEDFEL